MESLLVDLSCVPPHVVTVVDARTARTESTTVSVSVAESTPASSLLLLLLMLLLLLLLLQL